MKYVALLSGGKDSCYNLLHCRKNGHELVAAASLRPEAGKDEIDSYMYQTVGQDAIEFVAEALDVPLYRRTISGAAVDMSSEYGSRTAGQDSGLRGDETEDLFELLSTVKLPPMQSAHPEIQGVSVGAILSNYQRVRVEHVCRRLSLTPLCYLWQRDQRELLAEMIDAGLEAILIKVAGVGLTTKHLGKTLGQMYPTLLKLNDLYGAHVCGEGGEYETLTLDSPMFKRRIVLKEVEPVIHSDNDFATVAYLRIKYVVLEEKEEPSSIDPAVPPVYEAEYDEVRLAVEHSLKSSESSIPAPEYAPGDAVLYFAPSSKAIGPWVAITDVHRNLSGTSPPSIEDEVHECFGVLRDRLKGHSLEISHCANINIFISSMDLFGRINAVYSTYFGSSPPARACVAIDLPDGIRVKLDCIAFTEAKSTDRQALHVQGLSYWAPANIGPYSQAITAHQRVFISGQIGLLPRNLALPSPQSLSAETALACQHVHRIVAALKNNSGGGWQGHAQLALYWVQSWQDLPHIKAGLRALNEKVRTIFLGVPTLPKGALVEKHVVLHTGRFLVVNEDEEEEVRSLEPAVEEGSITDDGTAIHWSISSFPSNAATCSVICIKGDVSEQLEAEFHKQVPNLLDNALSVRVFYRPSVTLSYDPHTLLKSYGMSITSVPCRFVSNFARDDWNYAICIIGV
ncbi:hypothetical protein NM688_g2937 [Phlebia brevispora]|uniref:Uncharacterized protein n=1 Tax=Phlebia brevispora TaxID=194682 RepID=A0ACC1T7D6_9APHY|nr:hypothetical protein NM688_g2937 [Phlebia brevispora]